MVRAAMFSITGTARGTMQGSWRPSVITFVFSLSVFMDCCSVAMEAVGLMAIFRVMVCPVEMPPVMPPA